jgi:predicted component of type VI protein secretion system
MQGMMQTMQPNQQQQQQQQQLPTMMTPPTVVTTKDLLYLKDAMSWLLLSMKKCAHYAGEVQCQHVREAINQVGQMHQRQYNLILQHCQTNNTQQMASIHQQPTMQ